VALLPQGVGEVGAMNTSATAGSESSSAMIAGVPTLVVRVGGVVSEASGFGNLESSSSAVLKVLLCYVSMARSARLELGRVGG
jgi:hypothetical protein